MAPPPKRRLCLSPMSPISGATTATATASDLDRFLESALAAPDPSISIGLSLERILHSSALQSDKESLIDSAKRVASSLMDAAMRSARKLAAAHNSSVWPLNDDLTIKVFSMLDTESVCCAAATCTLFSKCASDPLCYAHIDLTRSVAKVSNPVVSTMIQRASKNLQSMKLGRLPQDKKTLDVYPLTWGCLSALVLDGGATGVLLRKLHLYNLERQSWYLVEVLPLCKSLVDLEIVELDIACLDWIILTICEHCHSIKRLCLDIRASGFWDGFTLEARELENLIKECPLLSSLALRGYEIEEDLLFALIKGASVIKSLDLSGSFGFSGIFLRDLHNGGGADSLETLILRDCRDLQAKEVSLFLSALSGDWKALRYADISHTKGLLHESLIRRAIDISQILQERPDIHLIADFPPNLYISPLFIPPPLFLSLSLVNLT